jgi:predicted anti-sigma-YlaC factor YlaD
MTPTTCQLLEKYLSHDLAADERARFEAHLQACAVCRGTIQEELGLDILLKSAVERLEPVPQELTRHTEHRLRAARSQRFAAVIAALAACVAAIVIVSRTYFRTGMPPATNPPTGQSRLANVPPPAPAVRVRFASPAGVIAVPIASDSPHVTLVQVYPALRATSARKGLK